MLYNDEQEFELSYEMKLKILKTQCLSLLFLTIIISFAINIFNFNLTSLIFEIILVLALLLTFIFSHKTKKIKPYNYIMFLLSNFFVIYFLLILGETSKITIFTYFPIIILFITLLFNKIEKIILIIIQCILYGLMIYHTLILKDASVIVYNMLIQTIIATCTILACFLNVLKTYEDNEEKLKEINNYLRKSALKDVLTNLWNRQYMNGLLDEKIENQEKFSIILFDIDHFKQINDTYGHLVGDRVLKKFAQILSKTIPTNASAIRYGGEEFLVVLPEKNQKQAFEVAEKIRKKVQLDLKVKEIKRDITISGGVKEYDSKLTKEQLIEKADKNLYIAKETGRNKIIN